MKLLLATRNAHKVEEIRRIVADLDVQWVTLDDFPDLPELPETGDTFEANALQKAREAHRLTGLWAVADDSGIEFDALGGRPGVHSKRFSEEGTDEANNRLAVTLLADQADRTARYRCVVAVVGDQGEAVASGSCEGTFGFEQKGTGGFGYDPFFLPAEEPGRTMAELTPDEKHAISHRGRAFRKLGELLTQLGL